MIRRASIPASSVLVMTLSSCTLWGVNQQEGDGSGSTGGMTGPSETTQVSNGELPTSAASLDSGPSEPPDSSSTTSGLADTGATSSTTDVMAGSAGTTLEDSSSDPTKDSSSDPTNDPGENCMSDPVNYVMINGDAADCRARSDVRFAFVTSVSVSGNMNGQVPNSVCNMLANVPPERPLPAPGKFRAWVSTQTSAPVLWEDFDQFMGPFVKYDTKIGAENNSVVVVAENWQGLLNAGIARHMLSAPIDVTESAAQIEQDDQFVWTGTNPGGALSHAPVINGGIFNCTNWTNEGADVCISDWPKLGEVGKVGAVDHEWTQYRDKNCNDNRCKNAYRLYCIQIAV